MRATVPDRRPCVLLIESDDTVRAAVRVLLRAHGYLSAAVEDPMDALAFFRGGGRAEAVVLDADPPRTGTDGSYSPTRSDRDMVAIIRNAPTVVCSSRESVRRRAGARPPSCPAWGRRRSTA
jgi:CheY-like chemotaxis protein